MSRALIEAAARTQPRATRRGLLESLFAQVFTNFVYPQIWEDPAVDMTALELAPGKRIATIASGGCNVMSYLAAGPADILAVDLNPAHIALLRLKLAAVEHLPDHAAFFRFFGEAADDENIRAFDTMLAPHLDTETLRFWQTRDLAGRRRIRYFAKGLYRHGVLGRTIGLAHLACKLHGADIRHFRAAQTVEEQRALFANELEPLFDKPLVRLLARMPTSFYGLGIPPEQFVALVAENAGEPAIVVRERLRRLLCDFPMTENYFAHQAVARCYGPPGSAVPPYLESANFPLLRQYRNRVRIQQRTMTEVLADEPSQRLNGVVLLDAQDWMTDRQLAALWKEIDRASCVDARVVFRTAGAASPLEARLPTEVIGGWQRQDELSDRLFAQDRSAVYGGFHVYARVVH